MRPKRFYVVVVIYIYGSTFRVTVIVSEMESATRVKNHVKTEIISH